MPVTLSDELLAEAGLSEREAKLEIACRLYDAGKLTMPQTARWSEIARVEFEAAQGSCAGFGAPLARCLWKLAGLGKRVKRNKYICNMNFILGTLSLLLFPAPA